MAVDAHGVRKGVRGWELRLGPMQLLIVLGAVTGSMACAFYLGFFSGRSAGYEAALAANVAHLPRLPINKEQSRERGDQPSVSDVYAKLKQNQPVKSDSKPAAQERKEASDQVRPAAPASSTDLTQLAANLGQNNAPAAHDAARPKSSLEEALPGAAPAAPAAGSEEKTPNLGSLLHAPAAAGADGAPVGANEIGGAILTKPLAQPSAAANDKVTVGAAAPKNEPAKAEPPKTVQAAKAAAAPAPGVKPDMLPTGSNSNKTGTAGLENFVREVIPSGWFAQLAAPRQLKDADDMARNLKGSGFPVVIEKARVRGEEYFRVLVGPEGNREQAERLLGQLRRERYVKSEPFLRRVN